MKKMLILGLAILSASCFGMKKEDVITSGMGLDIKTQQLNEFIAQRIEQFANDRHNLTTLNILNNTGYEFVPTLIDTFHTDNKYAIIHAYNKIYEIPLEDRTTYLDDKGHIIAVKTPAQEYYNCFENTFNNWINDNFNEIEKRRPARALRKLKQFPTYYSGCF